MSKETHQVPTKLVLLLRSKQIDSPEVAHLAEVLIREQIIAGPELQFIPRGHAFSNGKTFSCRVSAHLVLGIEAIL